MGLHHLLSSLRSGLSRIDLRPSFAADPDDGGININHRFAKKAGVVDHGSSFDCRPNGAASGPRRRSRRIP